MIGLDVLVAAGGLQALDRLGYGLGGRQLKDPQVAEARELAAHMQALAGLGRVHGGPHRGAGHGEDDGIAVALGDFLGGDRRTLGGGAGERPDEQQQTGKPEEDGFQEGKGGIALI